MAPDLITHDARTGKVFRRYSVTTDSEIKQIVINAQKAQKKWSESSISSRQAILRKVSERLLLHTEQIIEAEVCESGKFPDDALSDLHAASKMWKMAADILGSQETEFERSQARFTEGFEIGVPVGVVAMITPSNYPLIVLSERLPFALAAGCAVIAKPSEITPTSTLIIQQICLQCGVPPDIFAVVIGDGLEGGTKLVANKLINMVSFTGSTATARHIVSKIDPISVKTSFELGGKNSAVIFNDADIEKACESIAFAAMINGGRACIAVSRIVVHASVVRDVEIMLKQNLIQNLEANRASNGIGLPQPLSKSHFKRLNDWANSALNLGASEILICPDGSNHVSPRIFSNLSPLEPLFSEELFAPYLTLNVFEGYEDALKIANAGSYGLAGYCWTSSRDISSRFSRDIYAGRIWINSDMRKMDIQLPIGGFRESGIGRELGSDAVKRYTASKSVIV